MRLNPGNSVVEPQGQDADTEMSAVTACDIVASNIFAGLPLLSDRQENPQAHKRLRVEEGNWECLDVDSRCLSASGYKQKLIGRGK
ncbi:hypothetical protein GCM10027217_33640 [Pseudomaricurvus hydrocarbonicus]